MTDQQPPDRRPVPPQNRDERALQTAAQFARERPHAPHAATPAEVAATRDLFWQNVMRQILTSLSMEWLDRQRPPPPPPPDATFDNPPPPPPPPPPREELFDGRLGILTKGGERIAIASVSPILACGMSGSDLTKELSMAVECTVFQVRTPKGEIFTLPLHEIRGFHALTPELMDALERAARARQSPPPPTGPGAPFGFAAFTSMQREPPPEPPPPNWHPAE